MTILLYVFAGGLSPERTRSRPVEKVRSQLTCFLLDASTRAQELA